MTLLWAWQQLPIWLAASSSKHLHDIDVHYLGPYEHSKTGFVSQMTLPIADKCNPACYANAVLKLCTMHSQMLLSHADLP